MRPSVRLPVSLIAAAVLALTACSGGGSGENASSDNAGGPTPAADSSGSSDQQAVRDWALDYAECLRENGAESFPDPTFDEEGVPVFGGSDADPELQAAKDACEGVLQQAPNFDPMDEAELAAYQDRLLELSACMREHGVDMPDPTFDDEGNPQYPEQGDSKDAPDVLSAAEEACAPVMSEDGETPSQGETP
jgi:hypothetical protein